MTASTIAQLVRAFNEARRDIGGSQAHIADDILDRLEHEAFSVLYAENDRGGEARGIVAQVATAAGVDIDEGTGHRWDRDHMARVVPAVKALKQDLANARSAARMGTVPMVYTTTYVDELEDTIVSQAREIARLKGESA